MNLRMLAEALAEALSLDRHDDDLPEAPDLGLDLDEHAHLWGVGAAL